MHEARRGWAWPVHIDPATGGPALDEGPERVRRHLLRLLTTRPGELLGVPAYGCRVGEVLHAPASAGTAARAAHHVRAAVSRWEPGVVVEEVHAQVEADGVVRVEVRYRHRASGEEGVVLLGEGAEQP
ncbi:MAG: GPW/gp25 family protein [Alphaproteobacteria bacterium]|nr:GPW/gp25 family protein [Alphaproteobacteria bacterium]